MSKPSDTSTGVRIESRANSPLTAWVDVIILGGGPAGTSTALALAMYDLSSAILERSHYEALRIGETLPPQAREPLTKLGVWDQFLADKHLESPGIVSAWGRADSYDNDFILNPHGPGWHLDRRQFDVMLAHAAENAGADLLIGARPTSCIRTRTGAWQVDALVDGSPVRRECSALVDATGRFSSPARSVGGHRLVYDRLIGLVAIFRPESLDVVTDQRTLIEAIEYGWWYTAPLPSGERVVTLFTDADLLPVGRCARDAFWREQLQRAPYTQNRLRRMTPDFGLRIVPACSTRLRTIVASLWLAVGDAAASFDPLSSQGVTWAMESGLMAAHALHTSLGGHAHALDTYARWVEAEFAEYIDIRAEYYSIERRWLASPFWQRRQVRPA